MTDINELHERAMEYVDLAFLARRGGDSSKSKDLTLLALDLETRAANLLKDVYEAEPTRSILLRSAAALAIDCGQVREAEKLIAIALSGNPPLEIADELRDLLEQVNFNRHLLVRDIDLNPNEMQLSIAGTEAGYGIALSEVFIERVKDIERLIFRTVERILGQEYRERGLAKASVTRGYQLYISAPRPGSFAVTLRLGRQMSLPGFDISSEAISEVLECFNLLNNNQDEQLRDRIPQEAYFQNFMGLAKRIAPDGDAVKFVGLTSISGTRALEVPLTRRQQSISLIARSDDGNTDSTSKTIQITGQLKYASSINSNQIKVISDDGKSRTINVPEGLMNDIVKPLWDSKVVITATRRKRQLLLTDIVAAPD